MSMTGQGVVEIPMDRLLEWSDRSPVVRAEAPAHVAQPALGIRRGTSWAVAFVRPTHTHGHNLMLHAGGPDPEDAPPDSRALLEEIVASPPFAGWVEDARAKGATGVSLPRTMEHLGGLLGVEGGRWEWMWCTEAPGDDQTALVDLPESARDDLVDLLEKHNRGTDGQPFARPGQRWVGVREGAELLAAGCCEEEHAGAPILSGITVAPWARGRGLGRAVTAELTRGAIATHGWSTLGMYSHNDIARGLYLDLGYRVGARWTSGRLA